MFDSLTYLMAAVSLFLAFAAGVCVGRDTLARANRRLRRERDLLLAAQVEHYRTIDEARRLNLAQGERIAHQSELLSRKAEAAK